MLYLTQDTFTPQISQGVTLVDFYADWCQPCQILGKLMPHLSEKYKDSATVAKVNTDQEFSLAQTYGITGLPTVVVFKDGQEVERLRGLQPPEAYSAVLEKYTS